MSQVRRIEKRKHERWGINDDGGLIPVLPQFEHPIGTFASDQIRYLIAAGISATEDTLPCIRRLLEEPAVSS
jgi:hypothetical protein